MVDAPTAIPRTIPAPHTARGGAAAPLLLSVTAAHRPARTPSAYGARRHQLRDEQLDQLLGLLAAEVLPAGDVDGRHGGEVLQRAHPGGRAVRVLAAAPGASLHMAQQSLDSGLAMHGSMRRPARP